MLYDYKCNKCDNEYTKNNTIEHRNKSGRCPECTSKDTKKIMSHSKFRTCGTGHKPGGELK